MRERRILITNDDGLWSPGLDTLTEVASAFGEVLVVAPDRNRSAISSAMSLHNILRVHELGPGRYACDGTPVDCVMVGVRHLLGGAPDWVLAGINHGYNLGEDVFYSGTVGAAFEGCLQGARAAAFSMDVEGDRDAAADWIRRFLGRWEQLELPPNRIWNLNLPKGEIRGFRLAGQDNRKYHDIVEKRLDPRGVPYYWVGGENGPVYARTPGSDAEAVQKGFISVTPLRLDLACPELMGRAGETESLLNGEGGAPL
nr:5'/3'-nucleotidase SurE [uncultured Holophaga sp.]